MCLVWFTNYVLKKQLPEINKINKVINYCLWYFFKLFSIIFRVLKKCVSASMPNMIGQSFFCLILINAIQIITKITMGVQCAYSQLFKKKNWNKIYNWSALVMLKLCFWDCVGCWKCMLFPLFIFSSCEGIEEDYVGHGGGRWTHPHWRGDVLNSICIRPMA